MLWHLSISGVTFISKNSNTETEISSISHIPSWNYSAHKISATGGLFNEWKELLIQKNQQNSLVIDEKNNKYFDEIESQKLFLVIVYVFFCIL